MTHESCHEECMTFKLVTIDLRTLMKSHPYNPSTSKGSLTGVTQSGIGLLSWLFVLLRRPVLFKWETTNTSQCPWSEPIPPSTRVPGLGFSHHPWILSLPSPFSSLFPGFETQPTYIGHFIFFVCLFFWGRPLKVPLPNKRWERGRFGLRSTPVLARDRTIST